MNEVASRRHVSTADVHARSVAAGGAWGLAPFMGGTFPVWVLVLTCFVKLLAISITVLAGFRGAKASPET